MTTSLTIGALVRVRRVKTCLWAHIPTMEAMQGNIIAVLEDAGEHRYVVRFFPPTMTPNGPIYQQGRYTAAEVALTATPPSE